MTEPLFVRTEGLRDFARTHTQVAGALAALPVGDSGAVHATHGPIASAVSAALADALGVRRGTLETTSRSGNKLSDLLLRAAQAYENGDQRGAEALQAAANAMDDPGGAVAVTPTPAAATSPAAPAAGAGGAEIGGQLAGQIGQQVAQLGQLAAQAMLAPLQALAQPLQQLPQQLAQGLQQVGQPATKPADDADTAADGRPDGDEGEAADRKPDDEAGRGDRSGTDPAPQPPSPERPGQEPETPQRPRPAPTRPASV